MILSVTQKRLKERWKERLEVTERRGKKRKELPYGIKEEVKGKGKVHPKTGHEGPEGARWGWWSTPRLGHFTPGKDPGPVV
jgi:hypothetical protein